MSIADYANWKQKIINNVAEMTNEELLDEALSLQHGDDWDGGFTPNGRWECDYVEKILRERLETSGWLEKAQK